MPITQTFILDAIIDSPNKNLLLFKQKLNVIIKSMHVDIIVGCSIHQFT